MIDSKLAGLRDKMLEGTNEQILFLAIVDKIDKKGKKDKNRIVSARECWVGFHKNKSKAIPTHPVSWFDCKAVFRGGNTVRLLFEKESVSFETRDAEAMSNAIFEHLTSIMTDDELKLVEFGGELDGRSTKSDDPLCGLKRVRSSFFRRKEATFPDVLDLRYRIFLLSKCPRAKISDFRSGELMAEITGAKFDDLIESFSVVPHVTDISFPNGYGQENGHWETAARMIATNKYLKKFVTSEAFSRGFEMFCPAVIKCCSPSLEAIVIKRSGIRGGIIHSFGTIYHEHAIPAVCFSGGLDEDKTENGSSSVTHIRNFIRAAKKLESLRIKGQKFDIKEIATVVVKLTRVALIDADLDAPKLLRWVSQNMNAVVELDLSENTVSVGFDKATPLPVTLERLTMDRLQGQIGTLTRLMHIVRSSTTLKYFSMCDVAGSPEEIERVFRYVAQRSKECNNALEELRLDGIAVTPGLMWMIYTFRNLKTLSLSRSWSHHNDTHDDALCEYLKFSQLERFIMRGKDKNVLSSDRLIKLFDVLEGCRDIRVIDISGNDLYADGGKALKRLHTLLFNNQNIRSVILDDCKLKEVSTLAKFAKDLRAVRREPLDIAVPGIDMYKIHSDNPSVCVHLRTDLTTLYYELIELGKGNSGLPEKERNVQVPVGSPSFEGKYGDDIAVDSAARPAAAITIPAHDNENAQLLERFRTDDRLSLERIFKRFEKKR